jgi:hypothetical protein
MRRKYPRGYCTSVIASVVSYVLKNGPGSVSWWQGLTFYLGSRSESNMCAIFFTKMRHDVYKCVESPGHDPKPGDLGVGRLKRGESYVEDRKRY